MSVAMTVISDAVAVKLPLAALSIGVGDGATVSATVSEKAPLFTPSSSVIVTVIVLIA